jgi:dihydrofolate synthase/folylpolyglutamate synthase
MQPNSYKETIDWLFQQFPSYQSIGASAYKPDLGNIRALCTLLNDPQNDLKIVHIAGTNGKGSTSSMLASILSESGETVGLFTSPHIIDFRERIRVNGAMISENSVIEFCQLIRTTKLTFEPSFFEITFAMALVHFRNEKCSVCVIETGLGGRLDATNIVTPIVSVITNIAIEHTQFLGNTLEEIAGEKAGIIKPNIPVIIGETTLETKKVFSSFAAKNHSTISWCEDVQLSEQYRVPLLGDYQKLNLRTVLCTTELLNNKGFNITPESIQKGLAHLQKNTGFFGRMQIIEDSPLTILDVSHNFDGIKKTLETVQHLNKGKLHIIYGTSSDKNYKEIIQLFPKDCQVNLCTFSNQRSLNVDQMKELANEFTPSPLLYTSIKEAIKEVQSSANKEDTILAFGSFFLISDFF